MTTATDGPVDTGRLIDRAIVAGHKVIQAEGFFAHGGVMAVPPQVFATSGFLRAGGEFLLPPGGLH